MHNDSLNEILERCWEFLEEGAGSASSPMHTPVLATIEDGRPAQRTVVLRRVERAARELFCHTDARSAKVAQLAACPAAGWLFYDPATKVQIRARGIAETIASGPIAEHQWQVSSTGSRRCYLAEPGPGRRLSGPVSTLPECLRDRRPTEEEANAGRRNFMVIRTTIEALDWLWLSARGHRRASFRWTDAGLESQWTAP